MNDFVSWPIADVRMDIQVIADIACCNRTDKYFGESTKVSCPLCFCRCFGICDYHPIGERRVMFDAARHGQYI